MVLTEPFSEEPDLKQQIDVTRPGCGIGDELSSSGDQPPMTANVMPASSAMATDSNNRAHSIFNGLQSHMCSSRGRSPGSLRLNDPHNLE